MEGGHNKRLRPWYERAKTFLATGIKTPWLKLEFSRLLVSRRNWVRGDVSVIILGTFLTLERGNKSFRCNKYAVISSL